MRLHNKREEIKMTKKRTSLEKLFSIVLLAIILVIQVACPVEGISSSKTLNVPLIKQEKTWWCWAACGASVVRYVLNENCTQQDFCYRYRKNYDDTPAEIEEIEQALALYGISSHSDRDPAGILRVRENIDADKPLIANRVKGFSGHAVVICGYSYLDSQDNSLIYYMEPATGERLCLPYYRFLRDNDGTDSLNKTTWEGTVYNISAN